MSKEIRDQLELHHKVGASDGLIPGAAVSVRPTWRPQEDEMCSSNVTTWESQRSRHAAPQSSWQILEGMEVSTLISEDVLDNETQG